MNDILQKDSIFKVGKVISVEGRTIKIEVDKTKNSAHLLYQGKLLRNISVNGYVKITKGFTRIIGKVEGEFIVEDKKYSSKNYTSEKKKIKRILIVSLLGFFSPKGFERGIKELPLINNECFLLDLPEFEDVHNFVKKQDDPLTLGTLTHENNQEIKVGVNDLFASHIGIFGNTGSGKSYTLAKIYRELFLEYIDQNKFRENAQFYFIDFNGEYVNDNVIIDKDFKSIYRLNTRKDNGDDKMPIGKKEINNPEFWSVVLEATEKTQKPFIQRALRRNLDFQNIHSEVKLIIKEILSKGDKELGVKAIFNFLWELYPLVSNQGNILDIIGWCENNLGTLNNGNFYVINNGVKDYDNIDIALDYINPLINGLKFIEPSGIEEIRIKIIYNYYLEIVRGHSNREHISPLIKRLGKRVKDVNKVIEINDNIKVNKNITIVSLRDVNIEIRKILPLLICKQLYENKKELNEKEKYLNIIIDEAHNILSSVSQRESETWKDYRLETFEEIIKEGRKFGTFLTIASQRPSDISATIISQLHNFFLHRLINNNDIKAVERTVSYLDKLSFESLPILPTGTCILAGLSAQVPVMIDIGKIKPESEPDNKTMLLIENWKDELD